MNLLWKCVLFAAVAAGSALTPRRSNGSSTFVYSSNGATIILSVSAVASSGDIWFRFTAPAAYDWVAFGIGAQMKGALTFIAYPTQNGTALELSPRLSSGHTEPTYDPAVKASKIYVPSDPSANHIDPNSIGSGGNFTISGVCYNCTGWSNPPLDLTSTNAPFIFAVGPLSSGSATRWSDHPDAPLRSHSAYGQFTMDMKQATVQTSDEILVPPMMNTMDGAEATRRVVNSPHDYGSAFHAILLCLAIGVVIPFDSILVQAFHKTSLHYVLQGLLLILVATGLGLGFWVSTWFVRSRHFSSPHQILGYLTIIVLLAQIPVGLLWRAPALKGEAPRAWIRIAHQALTAAFWLLAVVDAGLGFNLALQPGYNKIWVPLILAVFILYLFAFGARACLSGHMKDRGEAMRLEQQTAENYKRAQEYAAQFGSHPQYSQYGHGPGGDVELQQYGQREPGVQYSSVQVPKQY